MNESVPRPNDPAALADAVRSLASDAYRSLGDQPVAPGSALDLSRRASMLQAEVDSLDADDLSQWLENLRQRIDSPGASPAPARSRAAHGSDDLAGDPRR
jgi:hypothetical protein